MPARRIGLLIAALLVLVTPAAATASTSTPSLAHAPITRLLFVQQGTAMARVASWGSMPLGFHVTAAQAAAAAERTSSLQTLHRRMHPLRVAPYVWRSQHPYWYIIFIYRQQIVGAANVSPSGRVMGAWTGPQAAATFTHGGWSWSVTSWTVLLPASLLFLLPFLDPRRLRQLTHLDALAILAFLVSWLLLAHAHLASAVWLVYPPLIYLLVRLLLLGFGIGGSGRSAPLLSMRTLLVGLPVILAARIGISLAAHQEIDVGYESVIGAFRALHHLPLYYNDPNHGDTYWPLTYLAYVPFELIFPWKNSLSSLHAADLAAVFFDLGTMLGLFLLGRQLRGGREGSRIGLVLVWAWATCPFSIIGLVVHTNDGLVSMLSVFALVWLRSPVFSGGLLGLATAAKVSPAGLLPLIAAPRQRGLRGAAICVATFASVVMAAVFSWLPPGGLSYFWQRTVNFQIHRFDVFSPWALHASLRPVQSVLEVLAVLLAALVAFFPRERSLAQVCAIAGAITIAVQLPATHWFYYYIMWFLPFAVVAFVARPVAAPEPSAELAPREWRIQPASEHEPAMAGA